MRQLKVIQSITARDTASLEKYLTEVSKIALITAEEESKLASQTRKGDEAALVALTKANLRFVISVDKQYQYRGLPLTDLINEGNLGLMKAAKNFDETKGFKFISYAVWWIRQSILQAINDKGRMVRLPSNKASLMNKVNHCNSQLSQSLEREPHTSELANVLQVTSEEITSLQGGLLHVSLDAPLSDENGSTMLEELPAAEGSAADKGANAASLQIELSRCLAGLPLIQGQIVKMFFGIDGQEAMSLEMIGNDQGFPRNESGKSKTELYSILVQKKSGYCCRLICLKVDRIDRFTKKSINHHGVVLLKLEPKWKFFSPFVPFPVPKLPKPSHICPKRTFVEAERMKSNFMKGFTLIEAFLQAC